MTPSPLRAGNARSVGRRICIVGSGTRFLSGISIYTIRLANAFAATRPVTVITLRRLLPARFYPGRTRVGAALTGFRAARGVKVFDGIDWYWLPSLLRALIVLMRDRPAVIVLQWWTATVLHTYAALAIAARLTGAKVVIEFHEILDTGEARMPAVRGYVQLMAPIVVGLASAYAVHSALDRDVLRATYPVRRRPIAVLPHGPYDHFQDDDLTPRGEVLREAPPDTCNLLFFGVIREYKGLDDLVRAFDMLDPGEVDRYWLTVVGETWEGWTLPAGLIDASRHRHRITFVNRYVHDSELDGYLRGADAVVLPYRRSSLSGPLHVAMGYGLPIAITDVGGNVEGAAGYEGLVLTPASDPAALLDALRQVRELRGRSFRHPRTWADTTRAYDELFARLGVATG